MKFIKTLTVSARLLFCLGLAACSNATPDSGQQPDAVNTPAESTPAAANAPAASLSMDHGTSLDWFIEDSAMFNSADSLLPEYVSPIDNASFVSKGTSIAVRYGPILNEANLSGLGFAVQGRESGAHPGRALLADDRKTIIFKPDQAFSPGEEVQVSIDSLSLDDQTAYSPLSFKFSVAKNQQPGGVGASSQPGNVTPVSAFPDDLTVPQDIPHFTVSPAASASDAEGYIFVAPIPWTQAGVGVYLLILDGQGQLVYYQPMSSALNAYDFKAQPNGRLSYFSQKDSAYYVMDSHYQTIETYQAGNGYTTDLHDLQFLPNGNALLMAYDAETVDMSQIVAGGKPDAVVTGLIIQELDPSRNVVFQWRSWDHVAYSDTTSSLTEPTIDLVHGNAIALANDGNLLLSSRNLSEITKISLKTGEVLWRLGGKANQFTFVNDQPFAFQHDIRQLPNGDLTLFDNHGSAQTAAPSRGVEYRMDEVRKTVTKVWEYQPSTPQPIFGMFMGDVQRLADGNTFLDWGAASNSPGYQFVTMNEVDPNGQPVFQLSFDQPYVSYRAFRSPWQGSPLTLPSLAYRAGEEETILGYSWNGATGVAAWQVYGGVSEDRLQLIDQQPRSGFETQSHLTGMSQNECYFQVAALDPSGKEMSRSKVISTDPVFCPQAP